MIRKEKLEELKKVIEELKTIEVIERCVKPEDKFLQSEAYYFKLNNGIVIPREKLVKGKKDGSATIVMPVTEDRQVLVAIEPRVFAKGSVGVGFPAGYIERDENIEEAAIRELREETGYVPKNLIFLDSFYQDEGCSSALNQIFLARGCEKRYEQNLDEDELVKYMLFSYEEVLELERLGYIMGGNAKLAIEKSKKYFRK